VDNRDPTASVVFRLKYGEIAAPHLSRVASGQGEIQAINALIVAGAIATTRTAEVLNTGQQDQRIAVRFGAFAAVKRVFRAIEQYSPAISEEDAISLARRVAGRMAEEADPQVFDAGVKALLQSTEIRRQRFERLPMAAWKCLSEGVGQKVRQLPCNAEGSAFLPAVRRSGAAIGAAAARMHAEFQRDPDTSKAVFELGADAWVFVLRCIEDGNAAPLNPQDQPEAADAKRAHREMLAGVVVEGRDLMVFSVRAIGANAAVFESKDPAEWVREGSAERDRTFTKRVNDLLGPGGVAKDPPLSYPPNRFIKK
jgi:hypothetical protein